MAPEIQRGCFLMRQYPKSAAILERNRRFLPGGVSSINRAVRPEIAFVKAQGAYLWDAEGKRYVDYHAAFAPYVLGHNDPEVAEAVIQVQRGGASLFGSGASQLEGELAELICSHVPAAEAVQILNTGSEATAQSLGRWSIMAAGNRIAPSCRKTGVVKF